MTCWVRWLILAASRLTVDFDSNKKVTEEVALLPSKRIRNQIAGFITVRALLSFLLVSYFMFVLQHLMKRIQRGPVRGISLKLQEEERERRMDFIPERSILDADRITVDTDTGDMLKALKFADIMGVELADESKPQRERRPAGDRPAGRRRPANKAQ